MKKMFRFALVSIAMILVQGHEGKAQTTYTFTYDASGNRLSRTIQLKSGSITQNDTVAAEQTRFEDLIGNLPVKIYPNPTKGRLKVEIPFSDELTANIGVYTLSGAMVKKMEVNSTSSEIDLSKQPPGVYLLRICINDSSSDWKIIKE